MATTPKEKDANPFTTAEKGAAMRRMKQAQLGMKTTMTLAEAAAKGREEEKRRLAQAELEKRAVASALKGAEKEDAMEVESNESVGEEEEEGSKKVQEDDDSDASAGVARNLDKELARPVTKKRRSEEGVKTRKDTPRGTTKAQGPTMTALRPSSYIPHKHTFLRVILRALQG